MTGVEMIAAERERQINEEGWTAAHDDEHSEGELARAAACYAIHGTPARAIVQDEIHTRAGFAGWRTTYEGVDAWPWDGRWDKRTSACGRVRELVKAGALVAAEIDRLQRCKP